MTPGQIAGWNTFRSNGARCDQCHTPPTFTNHTFRNIGLRPINEDNGRQAVTGNFGDRGRFKVPSLRNVGLKATFMHNGGVVGADLDNLRDVIDFYEEENGHNQFNENIDPLIQGINVPGNAEPALADFVTNALTDPRVAAETFPFDRPTLRSELPSASPEIVGRATPGQGLFEPTVIAATPSYVGNTDFKLGVHSARGGALAFVQVSPTPFVGRAVLDWRGPVLLEGNGPGAGYGTWKWQIPDDPVLIGAQAYMQWVIIDGDAPMGPTARSETVHVTIF
jgi:hypothetical protein